MKQKRVAANDVKGPFTMQDIENWNAQLMRCEQVRQECELAKQAGFPCDDQLQACTALRDQLMAMKRTYAPGVP